MEAARDVAGFSNPIRWNIFPSLETATFHQQSETNAQSLAGFLNIPPPSHPIRRSHGHTFLRHFVMRGDVELDEATKSGEISIAHQPSKSSSTRLPRLKCIHSEMG